MIAKIFFVVVLASGALSHGIDETELRAQLRNNEVPEEMLKSMKMSMKVEAKLLEQIKWNPQQKSNIMISMSKGDVSSVLDSLDFPEDATRGEKAQGVHDALNANSAASQSGVLNFLSSYSSSVRKVESFYITNQIYVEGAPTPLVNALSRHPDVAKIEDNHKIHLIDGTITQESVSRQNGKNAWGVDHIKAPEVWNEGTRGENIVVCVIDTGVNPNHEALKDNYVGADKNGWYDATSRFFWQPPRTTPYDDQSHGTHCTGSVLGTRGIGVAPGAKWSACKALDRFGSGSNNVLLKCMEWALCPTKPDGTGKDCNLAPHVVSNSWGSNSDSVPKNYEDAIGAWRKADIIPVFAAGNSGSKCQTMGSPGASFQVIAVGATDSGASIADFSSRGPVSSAPSKIKPEISGPGVKIVSAKHNDDTGYTEMSGTSMACPHVAGLVALMLNANRSLKYDNITTILYESANREVGKRSTCGGTWPNNDYGNGIIDAKEAIRRAKSS